ncbi:methyltransferase domain-containing protein [bacterium]|nr:methyltransferase domain-containing protein [bacterium]
MFFRFFNMSHNYSSTTYINKANHSTIIHHDCTYGIPLDDNIVPAVYSSHFFEHLSKTQAQSLLSECYRVLKPNGIIRICVPSLDEEVTRIKSALQTYPQDVTMLQRFVTTDIVGFNSYYSNHRWMYNFYEMKSILESAGFSQISEKPFKSGNIQDVALLDTRGGLHVEAIKI